LQGKDRVVTSTEIAENENIPHLFSIRVLKKMEKKGLLKTRFFFFRDDLSSFRPYESPKNALFDQTQMAFAI